MKKRNKSLTSLLLATILTVGTLTGCGGQEADQSAKETDQKTDQAAEVTGQDKSRQQESGDAETKLEKSTLNLYIPQSHFKDQWDTFIAKFVEYEKKEKNREVEIQLEMPNEDENKQVLRARLASDDAPDVFKARSGTEVPEYGKGRMRGNPSRHAASGWITANA